MHCSQTPDKSPTDDEAPVDIVAVHVLPWWILLGAFALCVGLAWLLRSVWWSKWIMLGLAVLFAFFLQRTKTRSRAGKLSPKQYSARLRILWTVITATALSFFIALLLPLGTIYVDNDGGMDVSILLNGEKWLSLRDGESKRIALTKGTYHVTVHAAEGNQLLDAHAIEITGCHQYVLNVLGAQAYYHGTLHYGSQKPPEMEVLTDKWFQLPRVDCLFRDPPAVISTVSRRNELPPATSRSFVTKGVPPQVKGRE